MFELQSTHCPLMCRIAPCFWWRRHLSRETLETDIKDRTESGSSRYAKKELHDENVAWLSYHIITRTKHKESIKILCAKVSVSSRPVIATSELKYTTHHKYTKHRIQKLTRAVSRGPKVSDKKKYHTRFPPVYVFTIGSQHSLLSLICSASHDNNFTAPFLSSVFSPKVSFTYNSCILIGITRPCSASSSPFGAYDPNHELSFGTTVVSSVKSTSTRFESDTKFTKYVSLIEVGSSLFIDVRKVFVA